jgi:hypothetical protein
MARDRRVAQAYEKLLWKFQDKARWIDIVKEPNIYWLYKVLRHFYTI